MKNLLLNGLIKFVGGIIVMGAIIFIPAGTLNFWNGWLYLGTMTVLITFVFIYLKKHDPELLKKRMQMHEKQKEQKLFVKISTPLFILIYIIPGLDYRFGWSHMPVWAVITATVFMILSYIMFLIVMMQNSYASRVIEIQKGQKVIDTGLYSLVRHPMYLAMSVLFPSSILVLGSYYAFIPMIFLPFLLVFRIIHEEKFLIKELPGYKEYTKKVKYRLIPFVW
jgi:protein-S-isoprenylcysteine O-methyltransferase Ste14